MDGLVVTQKDIEEYLNQRSGLTENTRSTYRARLNQLYDLLPQDKTIHRGTIKSIGETLLQRQYSKQAVNIVLAAADGFVVWSGHPEFQAVARYAQDDMPQPELILMRMRKKWRPPCEGPDHLRQLKLNILQVGRPSKSGLPFEYVPQINGVFGPSHR